jgi:hypothetical protein
VIEREHAVHSLVARPEENSKTPLMHESSSRPASRADPFVVWLWQLAAKQASAAMTRRQIGVAGAVREAQQIDIDDREASEPPRLPVSG